MSLLNVSGVLLTTKVVRLPITSHTNTQEPKIFEVKIKDSTFHNSMYIIRCICLRTTPRGSKNIQISPEL